MFNSSSCKGRKELKSLIVNKQEESDSWLENLIRLITKDKNTLFFQKIENFILCTLESEENNPQNVMRNIRHFITGLNRHLTCYIRIEIQTENMKDKFVNLNSTIENILHDLVSCPLREHVYSLLLKEKMRTGSVQLVADNMANISNRPMPELIDISTANKILKNVHPLLKKMVQAASPVKKLQCLRETFQAILLAIKSSEKCSNHTVSTEDFLPLFVWALSKSGVISAEMEAEYMFGLLHPNILSGEGRYNLTTLSYAVHMVKNSSSNTSLRPDLMNHFLRVTVSDDKHGSIITKTLPVCPNTTVLDVCKAIASKVYISNPELYGLFIIVDGKETPLEVIELPLELMDSGHHNQFSYRKLN